MEGKVRINVKAYHYLTALIIMPVEGKLDVSNLIDQRTHAENNVRVF